MSKLERIRVELPDNKGGRIMYPGGDGSVVWFKFSILGSEDGVHLEGDENMTHIMKHALHRIEASVIDVVKRNLMSELIGSNEREREVIIYLI